MWPITSDERLLEWRDLRISAQEISDLESSLELINNWWFRAPMIGHYLHWDDYKIWPGPWDLLADNQWCDLARALGIVYTIMMIQRSDITDLAIIQTEDDNLVRVNAGKYILNWAPRQLLNIGSKTLDIKNCIESNELQHLLG